MKKVICLMGILCATNMIIDCEKIVLDGAKQLDGFFIRGEDIETIYVFKTKIKKVIAGLQCDECAATAKNLQEVKQDIMQLARDFFTHEPHVKPLINKLIQEECAKRGNHQSILLEWCEIKHGHEIKAFDDLINSAEQLHNFTTDLTHFLEDVIESCPVAQAELKEIIKKWNAFKIALQKAEEKGIVSIDDSKRSLFLQHIKYEKLKHTQLSNCTVDYVVSLVNEFYAKQSCQNY